MLYVTTRNNRETYTAKRALMEDRAEDGGFYVPLRDPVYSKGDLGRLKAMSYNQRIAVILNRLFQTQLTRWDVDFAIGRSPVKLVSLRHRIVMGEFWHNPDWDYAKMESGLSRLLRKDEEVPGSWLRIAIRIAVLASFSLELCDDGSGNTDIAMLCGDFLWPVSAWYARKWGFPLGNIVMCCNENKSLWELMCYGQLKTDAISIPTELPQADISVPAELERLIYACGGAEETARYLDCCRRGIAYFADADMHAALQEGNFVSVVSSSRIRDIISGAVGTHQYLLSPGPALAYGGLLDYRAKKGSLQTALIICERNAASELQRIAAILGVAADKLHKYIE